MELAPACSPLAESPWISRSATSSTGASTPTCWYVGRHPTRNVEIPIIRMVPIITRLRPSRSPM